jgi:hypothetical protein
VDVGNIVLGVARGPDRSNRFAFRDAVGGADEHRAEMQERDGVAVGRPDRHRATVRWQRAGKGDLSPSRRHDRRTTIAADVEPRMTVLAVLGASEVEPAENGAVRRPRPRQRRLGYQKRQREQQTCCCLCRQHGPNLAGRSFVVKSDYSEAR